VIITSETVLEQQAVMFTDSENGEYTQEYSLIADNEKTGVRIIRSGNRIKQCIEFIVGPATYASVEKACVAAGHVWERG